MNRLILAFVFLCCSQPSMAADLCAGLTGKRLSIVANGLVGETHPTGLSVSQSNGIYSFTTAIHFKGEPLTAQQISGTCKDRHIVFTRANTNQEYDAWIFEKQPQSMAGLFTHKNKKTYGWYAELITASIKYSPCAKFDSLPCGPGPETKTCVNGVWPGPTSTSKCTCVHETNQYWEWVCK
ncbi:MAG TPA: hypothetical protein VF179_17925 [Thermoanaerobaculia bacterium]|nr:hypothetical protein [Thermoanaerobaculia bacterium]